ncbi:ribulose kinase [Rhizobium sp. AN70]|nr:ribulose kinase [Rhizobium sp. AN70]
MERDLDSLVALYVAGLCGIGYGLRQIIEAQAKAGADIQQIIISGGAGQHDLTRQILADTSGKPIISPRTAEPVLLGAVLLGATAAHAFSDLKQAMQALSKAGRVYQPVSGDIRATHNNRYEAFCAIQAHLRRIRDF